MVSVADPSLFISCNCPSLVTTQARPWPTQAMCGWCVLTSNLYWIDGLGTRDLCMPLLPELDFCVLEELPHDSAALVCPISLMDICPNNFSMELTSFWPLIKTGIGAVSRDGGFASSFAMPCLYWRRALGSAYFSWSSYLATSSFSCFSLSDIYFPDLAVWSGRLL